MLKELYDYGVRENLVPPPGFVPKKIKAYICLSENGGYLGMEDGGDEAIFCPDIGSLANGTEKCNILAEKFSIVLAEPDNKKTTFFRNALRDGSHIPALAACLRALEEPLIFQKIADEAKRRGVKGSDRITFRVDMVTVADMGEVQEWWAVYRKRFFPPNSQNMVRCLITGEMISPSATVPPIQGLQSVGGHGRGDALICFDKTAFCSYGLKQAANAPVSEEAFFGVKAALDSLLNTAPILAGMKVVHWYDRDIPPERDLFPALIKPAIEDEDEEGEGEGEENFSEDMERERCGEARNRADQTVNSIHTGKIIAPLDAEYFILLLTGVNGRVMVRSYEHGHYEELQKNLDLWYGDIDLTNQFGTGTVKPVKLVARLLRLIPRQKVDTNPFERLKKELSGITTTIFQAILTASPLPDTVAIRALSYIQSLMFDDDEERNTPLIPDAISCQWLKAWLMRKNRYDKKEEFLMAYYNPNHPEPAYHCGALIAVYAALQDMAMQGVNAGVVQRYYGAAIREPGFVLGQLDVLANHHLEKLTSRFWQERFQEHLGELYGALGDEIPKILNLEKQAYFALGFRQYGAFLTKEKKEKQTKEKVGSSSQSSAGYKLAEENKEERE